MLHSGGPGGNFFTIHVATPLAYCERTDRRGVYAKARAGEIRGFPGVDDEFEAPVGADLTVDTMQQNIPEIVHSEFFSLRRGPWRALIGALRFQVSCCCWRPTACCEIFLLLFTSSVVFCPTVRCACISLYIYTMVEAG